MLVAAIAVSCCLSLCAAQLTMGQFLGFQEPGFFFGRMRFSDRSLSGSANPIGRCISDLQCPNGRCESGMCRSGQTDLRISGPPIPVGQISGSSFPRNDLTSRSNRGIPCQGDWGCPPTHRCQGSVCILRTDSEIGGIPITIGRISNNRFQSNGLSFRHNRNNICMFDFDCGLNQRCVHGSCIGRRRPRQQTCQYDWECPGVSQTCRGGVCRRRGRQQQCLGDWECANNQLCRNGVCSRAESNRGGHQDQCRHDLDCEVGQSCVSSRCISTTRCSTSAQCDIDEHCVGGVCRPNSYCTTSHQCRAVETCRNNRCEPLHGGHMGGHDDGHRGGRGGGHRRGHGHNRGRGGGLGRIGGQMPGRISRGVSGGGVDSIFGRMGVQCLSNNECPVSQSCIRGSCQPIGSLEGSVGGMTDFQGLNNGFGIMSQGSGRGGRGRRMGGGGGSSVTISGLQGLASSGQTSSCFSDIDCPVSQGCISGSCQPVSSLGGSVGGMSDFQGLNNEFGIISTGSGGGGRGHRGGGGGGSSMTISGLPGLASSGQTGACNGQCLPNQVCIPGLGCI